MSKLPARRIGRSRERQMKEFDQAVIFSTSIAVHHPWNDRVKGNLGESLALLLLLVKSCKLNLG